MTWRVGVLSVFVALGIVACARSEAGPAVIAVEPGVGLQAAINGAPQGAVLQLAIGTHHGPISIDNPITLRGEPGTIVIAPAESSVISITRTSNVTLQGLRVEGGSDGVFVRSSTGVTLDGLEVTGSEMHGIFAHDAEVTISDCTVSGLRGVRAQGIEVTNSDGRPQSRITGCRIEGPVFEGIVTHVSRVTVQDNTLTGSTHRGIAITEMSVGEVVDNRVSNGAGTAYYCGDRSWCRFIDNAADHISAHEDGPRSMLGHALVVQFHAEAYVSGLSTRNIAGLSALVMLGSVLNPPDPLDRPPD